MRQPVSLAASRAFWPSRPMASESIRSGTVTDGDAVLLVDVDAHDLRGLRGVGHEDRRVLGPRDDVDLLAAQLRDHRLDPTAPLADGGADGVEALLAAGHGDLAAAARPRGRWP